MLAPQWAFMGPQGSRRLLASVWEDPDLATTEGRPRRRLDSITTEGRVALAQVEREAEALGEVDPGWSPS